MTDFTINFSSLPNDLRSIFYLNVIEMFRNCGWIERCGLEERKAAKCGAAGMAALRVEIVAMDKGSYVSSLGMNLGFSFGYL